MIFDIQTVKLKQNFFPKSINEEPYTCNSSLHCSIPDDGYELLGALCKTSRFQPTNRAHVIM